MDTFLNAIKSVFDNLGATVLLPIIIFFLALALGTKPGRAFRSAITIGIAFIGINLVFGLMWSTLTEVGQAMVTNTGLVRNVIDVGWPAAAAIMIERQRGRPSRRRHHPDRAPPGTPRQHRPRTPRKRHTGTVERHTADPQGT